MEDVDRYHTLSKPSLEFVCKEKGSKFVGYAFPVTSETAIKDSIAAVKKIHPKARHICFAWKLGVERVVFRTNDDGEPNNSAGQPIYGQILSANLTNVLVLVVRYFGGVKLGVGGLIRAYKKTAQGTLQNSTISERFLEETLEVVFDYPNWDKVLQIVKQKKMVILEKKTQLNCHLILSVKKSEFDALKSFLEKQSFLSCK